MDIEPLAIPSVKLIRPTRHGDARGFFVETYNRRVFRDGGLDIDFVQDNLSLSQSAGTVRGLHFQAPPHAQSKLVSVLTGRMLDIAVDIRDGSPTFGAHVSAELSADNGCLLFVPEGFAHGFCTLEPETRVAYKVSAYYAPEHDGGIHWNDPDLRLPWPIAIADAIVSEKDAGLPRLSDIRSPFKLQTA